MAQGKYTVTSTIQLFKIRCLFVSDWNLERPYSWVGGKASWSHWTSCRGWQGGHSFHALPPRIQCRYNAMRHSHQRPHHSRLQSGEPQVCSFATLSHCLCSICDIGISTGSSLAFQRARCCQYTVPRIMPIEG